MIDRFNASIGETLLVIFKSGYKDYVSRRQIKNVKERMGIKRIFTKRLIIFKWWTDNIFSRNTNIRIM